MFDDNLKKFNEQLKDKDEQIIIPIVRGFIQPFVEDNYGRKLTEAELKELSWLVWEDGEQYIWDWLDEAISQIIEKAKQTKKK